MADASAPSRRIAPATIALILAALLLAAAVAVKLFGAGAGDGDANANAAAAAAAAGSADETIATLNERLRQDPDNDRGWFMLGMVLRDSDRLVEAAQAFRRAAELAPANADYAAYRGEMALLAAARANRPVPAEAEQLFRRALELQPGHPQARFYLATIRDDRGDHRGAIDDLIALLGDAPANAVWPRQVRDSIAAIARENRIDVSGRLPPEPAAPASPATAAIPGPTPQQMAAARAIPPGQQDQMVRAMVDGLAARLRQNPRDADGWIRLMRSRMVMNEPDAASAALRSALAAFQGEAATQARLRGAARELGVP